MNTKTRLTLAAIALVGSVAIVNAQTTADPHHPAGPASSAMPAAAPTMPGMDMGKMMQGGMRPGMGMGMGMSMSMGMGMGMMMPAAHIEGHVAFLKAELAITDAQLPQWNAVADVMRANAKGMHDGMAKMMQTGMPTTAPARGDAMVQMMSMHLDGMKAMLSPGKALYAVLTDAQKKLADEMTSGPMGRM